MALPQSVIMRQLDQPELASKPTKIGAGPAWQRPRKDHECDPILALAQRTLLVPMLYLLMEVLRIGARLCMKVDALDDLCVLSLSSQIRKRFFASPSGPILQRRFVSEVLLNGVSVGTCSHNNSGIIRARERVFVENVCHFVCG